MKTAREARAEAATGIELFSVLRFLKRKPRAEKIRIRHRRFARN